MLMARSGFPVPWNEGGGFRRGLPLRGDKVPMGSLKNSWPFHGSFFTKTGKPDLSGWTECGRKARKARNQNTLTREESRQAKRVIVKKHSDENVY